MQLLNKTLEKLNLANFWWSNFTGQRNELLFIQLMWCLGDFVASRFESFSISFILSSCCHVTSGWNLINQRQISDRNPEIDAESLRFRKVAYMWHFHYSSRFEKRIQFNKWKHLFDDMSNNTCIQMKFLNR